MNVTCEQCGKSIFVMNSLAGKKVKCQCGAIVSVPAAAAPVSKPMFKPGSLKLPPKPQLKPGLKLASGITGAPAPAPAQDDEPASVPEPVSAPTPAQDDETAPVPEPVIEPNPTPPPVSLAPSATVSPDGAADLASRLNKLKALFEMGAISADEHASQRERILAEI